MRIIKTYKLFESQKNLQIASDLVKEYISLTKWDIENTLGNCAFFAKDFYLFCKSKGVDCKLVYLKQDQKFATGGEIEDHIIPMVDNILIDFVYSENGVSRKVRQGNPQALKSQINPELTSIEDFEKKYSKWGYPGYEIITFEEIFSSSARKATIDYPKVKNIKTIEEYTEDCLDILLDLKDKKKVEITKTSPNLFWYIDIRPDLYVNGPVDTITFSDLEEYITRIEEYCKINHIDLGTEAITHDDIYINPVSEYEMKRFADKNLRNFTFRFKL